MSAHAVRFADLVEMIDRLPLEQQESLVDVVRKRMADQERRRINTSIRSARREHARGRTRPATADELMREILS
jgi:hypothetical protein